MDRTIASGAVDSGSIPLGSMHNSSAERVPSEEALRKLAFRWLPRTETVCAKQTHEQRLRSRRCECGRLNESEPADSGCEADGANKMPYLISLSALFLAAVLLFSLRSKWERGQLKIEHYSFRKQSGEGTEDKTRKVRLAFLSDLHDYFRMKDPKSVLEAIEAEEPDIIILGGDFFTVRTTSSSAAPDPAILLDFIAGLAGKHTVIFGYGNHERKLRELFPKQDGTFREKLRQLGVVSLENSSVILDGIAFYGVDPEMKYYRKFPPGFGAKEPMPEKYLIGKLGIPDPHRINVLLLHTPMYLKEAAAWGADLVLSGHFHGGTIRLPGGRGLMTPQYQFFCRECSGEHICGSTKMIANRGLGTHTFHIRLNNLPEISIIDIYAGTEI